MISREDLFKYTEFLLPAHNCVVIPNLGGFILNMEMSQSKEGCLMPPTSRIAFNPDLQYDDGLLTSELAKTNSDLTYASISKVLLQLTSSIRQSLIEGKRVECGKLGVLEMQEDHICFIENEVRVHPAYFGLSKVNLALLSDIDVSVSEQAAKPIYIRRLKTVASIAAAIVIFFLFVVPTTRTFEGDKIQKADLNMISDAVKIITDSHDMTTPSRTETTAVKTPSISGSAVQSKTEKHSSVVLKTQDSFYYLIVASCNTKSLSQKIKISLRRQGFSSTNVLQIGNHYRIFTGKYNDKNLAMKNLSRLKREYPAYSTAWVLHK